MTLYSLCKKIMLFDTNVHSNAKTKFQYYCIKFTLEFWWIFKSFEKLKKISYSSQNLLNANVIWMNAEENEPNS